VLTRPSVTLVQGNSQVVQVTVSGQNGFTGSVSIAASNLPAGVTVTPATLSVSPGSPGFLTLAATTTAVATAVSVAVNGAAQELKSNCSLSLVVKAAPLPIPFRNIGGSLVHGFYDPVRQLLFATNPDRNELEVISPTDLSVKARVPVPAPWGIDQMSDRNTLVIGTKAQELVTVNEDSYAVTRHPVPISAVPDSFPWDTLYPNAIAMSNGKVILIGQEFSVVSNDYLDGGQALVEWDSNSNTFSPFEPVGSAAKQGDWETDSLARSADGKWAAFSGDQFYLYSSDSDSLISVPFSTVNPPQNDFSVRAYALNSDGSKIAVVSATQVTFLDRSFDVLGTVQIPSAYSNLGRSQFSLDGSRLYLYYGINAGYNGVEVIDANSMVALGFYGATASEAADYSFLAVDDSQRAYFGSAGYLLATNTALPPIEVPVGVNLPMPTYPVLTPDYFSLNSSAEASLSGGMWSGTAIYLGSNLATVSAAASTSVPSQIDVPASSIPGPLDIESIDSAGYYVVVPSAISYGVAPVASSASLLPTSGNPTDILFGYGIVDAVSGTMPAVTIGGSTAPVVSTDTTLAFDFATSLQGVTVNVPSGSPDQSAAITVSNSIGSGTLANAVTYIASTAIIPGSGILQLLFDTHRNLLYAMKAREVDVLNPLNLQWQSPLALPSSATTLQFGYMALSPDGTKLVIATTSQKVVVLDPDQPALATVVAIPWGFNSDSGTVAITQSNVAVISGTQLALLDLSSLSTTSFGQAANPVLLKASADGSHIYCLACSIDPSTYAIVEGGGFLDVSFTDLAVSPDGSQFATISAPPDLAGAFIAFYDSGLRISNTNVYPDLSPPSDSGVLGAAYSPQGQVLVVALGNSIEFWDAAEGTLRARLMTPEELKVLVYPETWAPVMALDSAGQTIYAVSASGVTVLKLPTPIEQIVAEQWPLAVRGGGRGGFQNSIAARLAATKERTARPVAASQ